MAGENESSNAATATVFSSAVLPPKRWVQLTEILKENKWELDRISGSHHIFTKPGSRCIPVAFHGGTVSRRYASLILKQAGITKNSVLDHILKEDGVKTDISDLQMESTGKVSLDEDTEVIVSGTRYIPTIPKKIDIDKRLQKERQLEQIRLEYQHLKLQSEKEQRKLENEQGKILETIQTFIFDNDYQEVLDLTSTVDILDLGSSSKLYDFNCNIIFYRIIALGEHALSSLEFNSVQQQEMINEALDYATIAMKASLERRDAVQDLISNLQQRVIARYLEGLIHVNLEYMKKDVSGQMEAGAEILLGFLDFFSATASIFTKEQKKYESKTFYELMDMVTRGFEFMSFTTDKKRIPFDKVMKKTNVKKDIKKYFYVHFVAAPIRKMFRSFTFGQYDITIRIIKAIDIFNTNNCSLFDEIRDLSIGHETMSYFLPGNYFVTSKRLLGIKNHLECLMPVYQFGNRCLNWTRVSGSLIKNANIDFCQRNEVMFCIEKESQFNNIMQFMDMFISVFERHEEEVKDLMTFPKFQSFIIDSFIDPIQIAANTITRAMGDTSEGAIGKIILPVLRACQTVGLEEALKISRSSVKAFKKKKYDAVRVRIIQLIRTLLRLIDIMDDVLPFEEVIKVQVHTMYRFKVLPKFLIDSCRLLRMMIEEENVALRLFSATVQLQVYLEYTENVDNKTGQLGDMIRSNLLSNETGLASKSLHAKSMERFTDVFNTLLPYFLARYAMDSDLVKTIHELNPSLDVNKLFPPIERLAYNTIDRLSKFESYGKDISQILQRIVSDTRNHTWCNVFSNNKEKKRWAKSKSKKYSKLINRLIDNISSEEVQYALGEWSCSFHYLLTKLKASIDMENYFEEKLKASSKDDSQMSASLRTHEAVMNLPPWNHDDIHYIRTHMMNLLKYGGTLTGVLHRATGSMFPFAKSVFDEKWEMGATMDIFHGTMDSTFFRNQGIIDINYVNAIMEQCQDG